MNAQEKELIRGAIEETIDSMTRVAAEKDLQKDIVARVKEETTITPRAFNRLAKVAFKANFTEEVAQHEEFEELYQEIVGGIE